MTPNEAIRIVKRKTQGHTRYEGQEPFLDEVLVEEIERLRAENQRLEAQALADGWYERCEGCERVWHLDDGRLYNEGASKLFQCNECSERAAEQAAKGWL